MITAAHRRLQAQLRLWLTHPLGNALWFNLVWLSCVAGQNRLLGFSACLLVLHFYACDNSRLEWQRALPPALTGITIDGLASYFGFFVFDAGYILPPWLVILWIAFSVSLNYSFRYFARLWPLAVVFGAAGGCLSYWGAYRMGAVDFGSELSLALPFIFVEWAFLFPCLLLFSQRLNKTTAVKISRI